MLKKLGAIVVIGVIFVVSALSDNSPSDNDNDNQFFIPAPLISGTIKVDYVALAKQQVAYAYVNGWKDSTVEDLYIAISVSGAESKYNTLALGDMKIIRGLFCPSHGPMQIRSCPGTPHGMDRGTREQLINPNFNWAWAWRLRTANGWTPTWSTYTNGDYLDWSGTAVIAVDQFLAENNITLPHGRLSPVH